MIITKQQNRANYALEALKNINENLKIDEKLSTFLVGLPTMLITNGLGQTMAYLASRKDTEDRKQAYLIIQNYICKKYDKFKTITPSNTLDQSDFDFLQKFTTLSSKEYTEIQTDVLRMLEWLKRYARAFCVKSNSKTE